ncbi:MAG: aspartate/glutamate racemase family protein [Terriglobia bacterium]
MTADRSEPHTFGLVAGLGVGAGIFYYRSLVNALLARGIPPSILAIHADVRRVMAHAQAREARELAAYLSTLLRQLADGGAQIGTIPAFSPQICARELAEITPLPLIDLLDTIVAEVDRRGWQRVAIVGARVTMETELFGRLENRDVVTPRLGEIDLVSSIYVRIVEGERASTEDEAALRAFAHTLIERERLDGILLAGTDLSFVFTPENTDFPHIDGARTHIDAIVEKLALEASDNHKLTA